MGLFHDIQKKIDGLGFISREIASAEAADDPFAPVVGKDEYEWYNDFLFVSNDRFNRYSEYFEMARYPLIKGALDVLADDATQRDRNGHVIQVESDNKEVKQELNYLLHKVLNLDEEIRNIVFKSMVYGDAFYELIFDKELKNVVGVKNLPAKSVIRIEINNKLYGFMQQIPGMASPHFDPFEIIHFMIEESDGAYRPYGLSYLDSSRRTFRRLSLMEDAMVVYRVERAPERRIFYINTGRMPSAKAEEHIQKLRNSLRKKPIFDQLTGELSYKSNPMTVSEDIFLAVREGQESTKIDQLPGGCFAMDTKVPLLDGRELTIAELTEEFKNGKQNWAYSVNPETGKIVPGKITWSGVTHERAKALKLTIDNGSELIVTPEHKFPTKNRGVVEAKNLTAGDSLFPFHVRYEKLKGRGNKYTQVHSNDEWHFVHRLVHDYFENNIGEFVFDDRFMNHHKTVVHHKDFNRLNNNPENLVLMNPIDHWIFHSRGLSHDELIRRAHCGGAAFKKKFHDNEQYRKNHISILQKASRTFWDSLSEDDRTLFGVAVSNGMAKVPDHIKAERKLVSAKNVKLAKIICDQRKANDPEFKRACYEKSGRKMREHISQPHVYKQFVDRLSAVRRPWNNASVMLDEHIITIIKNLIKNGITTQNGILREVNSNKEFMDHFKKTNERQNSAINKIRTDKFIQNHLRKLYKRSNCKNWAEFVDQTKFYNHKIVKIEELVDLIQVGTLTIDGDEELHSFHNFALCAGVFANNSNLSETRDVQYFQDLILKNLKVPRQYIADVEGNVDRRGSLSQLDIRVARTIDRIQRQTLRGVYKICIIHLLLNGHKKEDVWSFKLSMTPSSSIAEQEKLAVEKDALEYASNLHEFGLPKTWIMSRIMKLGSFEECLNLLQLRHEEDIVLKKAEAKVEFEANDYNKRLGGSGYEGSSEGDMIGGFGLNDEFETPRLSSPDLSAELGGGGETAPVAGVEEIPPEGETEIGGVEGTEEIGPGKSLRVRDSSGIEKNDQQSPLNQFQNFDDAAPKEDKFEIYLRKAQSLHDKSVEDSKFEVNPFVSLLTEGEIAGYNNNGIDERRKKRIEYAKSEGIDLED